MARRRQDGLSGHPAVVATRGWLLLARDPDPDRPHTHRLFVEMEPYPTEYLHRQISPEGEGFGVNVIAAMRETVGPSIGILLDAHGHYNVPTAVRLCKRLEPYNLGWFEEPTPPESIQAHRAVAEGGDGSIRN